MPPENVKVKHSKFAGTVRFCPNCFIPCVIRDDGRYPRHFAATTRVADYSDWCAATLRRVEHNGVTL